MRSIISQKARNWMNRDIMKDGSYQLGHIVELVDAVPDHIDEDCFFYGGVAFINDVVQRFGYTANPLGYIPNELLPYSGRTIWTGTLAEAEVFSKTTPLFVKPIPERQKEFNGFVMSGAQMDTIYYINYVANGDEVVMLSTVVDIQSEWRCFVLNGELIGSKHYKGDFRISPDYKVMDEIISKWEGSHVAWSCDLGVTDKGQTIIVECHDVMCLGLYGLESKLAALMVQKRWEQIHEQKKL